MTRKKIPEGMVEVSSADFFKALYADPRDIMPTFDWPNHGEWRTNDNRRILWGWSYPGWKNLGECEKIYALFSSSIPSEARDA